RVELTRLGRALLPQLEEIERRLNEVLHHAEALAGQQSSVLRLGVMCTVGPGHVIQILQKLRTNIPELDVTIIDAKAEDVVRLLPADEIDIGVSAQPSLPEEVGQEVLFAEKYVVAMPAGHALAAAENVEFTNLEGVQYLERRSCEFDEHYEAAQGTWPFEF